MKPIITAVTFIPAFTMLFSTSSFASIEKPDLKEYFHLGEFYLQVGKPEQAINNYRAMIQKYPRSREAEKGWIFMGNAYLALYQQTHKKLMQEKTGERLVRESLRSRADKYRDKTISSYQYVVDNFPGSAGLALVRLGRAYAFTFPDGLKEGRAFFRRAMGQFPEEAGRAALFLGDSYFHNRQYDQARAAYRQARFFYPEVAARAQTLFSQVDQKQKNQAEALDDLAAVLNPFGIDGHFSEYRYQGNIMREAIEQSADILEEQNNMEEAVNLLKRMIRLYPGTNISLQSRLRLAQSYSDAGDKEMAGRQLDQIITEYPQSLYAARAYLKKAEIASPSEAPGIYRALERAFPKSKFRLSAGIKEASANLALAKRNDNPAEKKLLRQRAGQALKNIIQLYPHSPEAEQARQIISASKL